MNKTTELVQEFINGSTQEELEKHINEITGLHVSISHSPKQVFSVMTLLPEKTQKLMSQTFNTKKTTNEDLKTISKELDTKKVSFDIKRQRIENLPNKIKTYIFVDINYVKTFTHEKNAITSLLLKSIETSMINIESLYAKFNKSDNIISNLYGQNYKNKRHIIDKLNNLSNTSVHDRNVDTKSYFLNTIERVSEEFAKTKLSFDLLGKFKLADKYVECFTIFNKSDLISALCHAALFSLIYSAYYGLIVTLLTGNLIWGIGTFVSVFSVAFVSNFVIYTVITILYNVFKGMLGGTRSEKEINSCSDYFDSTESFNSISNSDLNSRVKSKLYAMISNTRDFTELKDDAVQAMKELGPNRLHQVAQDFKNL